jgi:hypothetical protein
LPPSIKKPVIWVKSGVAHHFSPKLPGVFLDVGNLGYLSKSNYSRNQEVSMRRTCNFLYGAFIGGLIGATMGLLLAPASGEEVRKQMKDRSEQIQLEVKNAGAARRAEMEKQLETLRAPRQ